MIIERLQLINYRNYESLDLEFSPNINVLIGENAQGKTNILESIYVLAMAKSHRTSNDKELIRWGEDYGKIKGEIRNRHGRFPLELLITKKGKKGKVNHIEQSKLSNYIGQINVVMFAPEDLNIVKGSPQVRRRFIDMEIGQISPIYLHELLNFQKLLKQRNQLLKSYQEKQKVDEVLFDIYTEQYIQSAIQIIRKRFEFVDLLQEWAEKIHSGISQGMENLKIKYFTTKGIEKNWTNSEMTTYLAEKFAQVKEKEMERGLTLIGPHRDDLQFLVNDYDVQTYGSQGQQRTTALSLKLAEIELIKQETGESPILLLDDVLSELDDFRQSHLLNTIQEEVQTLVTTTSVDGIHHETLQHAKMFHVKQGKVETK
ncbi:DNA replication/repair protein RecF [Ureibacillus sp. FSL K6-8385]|uniref:DNA replication and repair protein RecF n=1 Tax=Ureibacillus terrenus TaxID=118246 RepID=A0A540V2Y7_9BACL|nr:DNA replication/repair protein RecF [Ureibacillus terrenus]MED3661605.1 DNA replication/repair protein RecF [Ureibacillus terrenus]MED3763634.1 DNA replication/repair protein RecF [Ureibacillus terrenus]TQE91115.1 DNA replication/repair protein RecF [Ureibacillus terrenus]